MSGIINQRGSVSGIIGTTVGTTAAAAGIDADADSWHGTLRSTVDFDSDAVMDMQPVKLGSNVTESAGAYTCATAGWYLIILGLSNHGNTTDVNSWFLRLNGTIVRSRTYWDYDATCITNYMGKNTSWIYECSAGQYWDVFGQGRVVGDGAATGVMTWFSGVRLGA